MSVINATRDYLNKMLTEVHGMKALLMDDETMGVVSMVYAQSECAAKEVYLFRGLAPRREVVPAGADGKATIERDVDESETLKAVGHLKAVCLLRPTADNIALLIKQLKEPRFASYHLYFTNALSKSFLKQIADADTHDRVQCVKEYFADFFPVNHELFSLNVGHTRALSAPHWAPEHHATFGRMVEGLSSSLLSFRIRPLIRYFGKSEVCKKLALDIAAKMKDDFPEVARPEGEPLLLILDRRVDPVTPLLTQWTYQAMVHELLGIEKHRVDLRPHRPVEAAPEVVPILTEAEAKAAKKKKQDDKEFEEIVLSPLSDSFFATAMFQNWGEVATRVHELVTSYARQNKQNSKMDSFEDIKKFVDDYPQFRALQTNACKHMALAVEINRKIDTRRLLEVTELEQELACVESHTLTLEKLMPFLDDPRFGDSDKLRVAMLYALRYEMRPAPENQTEQIKALLRAKFERPGDVEKLDALLEYAGAAARSGDLFSQKSIAKKAAKIFELFSTDFQGADSAFTSHKPFLGELIAALNARSLKSAEYPFADGDAKRQYHHKFVMVFIVGGATFEEAKLVHELNAANEAQRIVLGGTSILNSNEFLAEFPSGAAGDDHAVDVL